MKRLSKQLAWTAVFTLGAFGVGHLPAGAAEVLVNGNLEQAVSPPFWTVTQTVTGQPGASVNASEHVPFANNPVNTPGELGMFIRPYAGNTGVYSGQNQMVNFSISQTLPVASIVLGNTFTLTGDSFFADQLPESTNDGYAGGVTVLDTRSPSDPTPENDMDPPSVTSPTQTTFELAFLDINGVQLGSSTVLDLRLDRIALAGVANDSMWRTHTLTTGAAPTGTRNVRVTASATNMVENFGFQDLYLDNFTLRRSGQPGIDILNNNFPNPDNDRNGKLNLIGEPVGWDVFESVNDLTGFRDFADRSHPRSGDFNSDGKVNAADYVVWRKNETANNPLPNDNELTTQTDRFNLWRANFHETPTGQQGFWLKAFTTMTPTGDAALLQTLSATAGAEYTFSAWSAWEQNYSGGLPSSPTQSFIKMEFLDGPGAMASVLGTELVDLQDEGQVPDTNTGEGNSVDENDWRQFSVNGIAPIGTTHVRVSAGANDMFLNTDPNQSAFFDDFSLIEELPGSGAAGVASVPEPAAYCLALIALAGGAWMRRRGS